MSWLWHGKVDDIHGLLCFLDHDPFADKQTLSKVLLTPYSNQCPRALMQLRGLLAKFMLRRSKAHVEAEINLPPCFEKTTVVKLGSIERTLYDSLHSELKKSLRNIQRARGGALALTGAVRSKLEALRKVCVHPQAINSEAGPDRQVAVPMLTLLNQKFADAVGIERSAAAAVDSATARLVAAQQAVADSIEAEHRRRAEEAVSLERLKATSAEAERLQLEAATQAEAAVKEWVDEFDLPQQIFGELDLAKATLEIIGCFDKRGHYQSESCNSKPHSVISNRIQIADMSNLPEMLNQSNSVPSNGYVKVFTGICSTKVGRKKLSSALACMRSCHVNHRLKMWQKARSEAIPESAAPEDLQCNVPKNPVEKQTRAGRQRLQQVRDEAAALAAAEKPGARAVRLASTSALRALFGCKDSSSQAEIVAYVNSNLSGNIVSTLSSAPDSLDHHMLKSLQGELAGAALEFRSLRTLRLAFEAHDAHTAAREACRGAEANSNAAKKVTESAQAASQAAGAQPDRISQELARLKCHKEESQRSCTFLKNQVCAISVDGLSGWRV